MTVRPALPHGVARRADLAQRPRHSPAPQPARGQLRRFRCHPDPSVSSAEPQTLAPNLATPSTPISSCCFSRLQKPCPTTTSESATSRQICAIGTTEGRRREREKSLLAA